MKILLTGKNGQVGWELARSLMPLGEVIALDRTQCDLSRPETIPDIVQAIKPGIIVNAAAYTAVDNAEDNEVEANLINGHAPGVLAAEAKQIGALLVHYSTDYIFDGNKTSPYTEDDTPNPINAYGRSKLMGETAIQVADMDSIILRTSWVYAARGANFLRTILRLAQERDELSIVADQIGRPTWARLIAESTAHVIRQSQIERSSGSFQSGCYHLAAEGETSWFGFTEAIVEEVRRLPNLSLTLNKISPISTQGYPTPAQRPMNSRLATDSLTKHFGLLMSPWSDALQLCLAEYN